jgi:hypothetical protein
MILFAILLSSTILTESANAAESVGASEVIYKKQTTL